MRREEAIMADEKSSASLRQVKAGSTVSESVITITLKGQPKQIIHTAFQTAVHESDRCGTSVIVKVVIGKATVYVSPNSSRRALLKALKDAGDSTVNIGPMAEVQQLPDVTSQRNYLRGRVLHRPRQGTTLTHEQQSERDRVLSETFRPFWV